MLRRTMMFQVRADAEPAKVARLEELVRNTAKEIPGIVRPRNTHERNQNCGNSNQPPEIHPLVPFPSFLSAR